MTEPNPECRALAPRTYGLDRPVVGEHHRLTDAQAKSQAPRGRLPVAGLVPLIESLEHVRQVLGADADPGIRYLNHALLAVALEEERDRDPPPRRGKLDGVVDQVVHHLPQSAAVALNYGRLQALDGDLVPERDRLAAVLDTDASL